ncbi:MAG: hypothetical protein OHK0046_41170 [Anaerolineae bacterium]
MMAFIFFFLFALILVGMYIVVRRQLAEPLLVGVGGVLGSIITMGLFMGARGVGIVQAVILGVLLGTLFAGVTLAVAWYFQSGEIRARQAQSEPYLSPED